MLKSMREGSAYFIKGVMLVIVVAFIGTIFVVWGVQSTATPGDLGRRGFVATVGDHTISVVDYQQALRQQVDQYRQLLGDKFNEKMADSLNLKQQVLAGMIRRALILQYAERDGVRVTPEELADEIRHMALFGGPANFSRERYLAVLRANRLTPQRFESDLSQDLTVRKMEGLVREAVKVSNAEVREAYQRVNRQLTVEVVQLPAGEEGKTLADGITVAMGKGKSLAAASQEAGVAAKSYGPFPLDSPPKEIPDPQAFQSALNALKPGEISPLLSGAKASYLIRLVKEENPPEAQLEKNQAAFRTQFLAMKREAVLASWLEQLQKTVKVTIDQSVM
jgi:parvulin-like peptidyl-prolyl isomerase